MSVFIINNKKYDTEKMSFICEVKKRYSVNIFGVDYFTEYSCKMYRSEKGNFLLVRKMDYNTLCGEAITEAEAKILLLQNYKKYEELFGLIEEA